MGGASIISVDETLFLIVLCAVCGNGAMPIICGPWAV